MSEPSPEAKRILGELHKHPVTEEIIDIATAKLREELEQMKQYALKLDAWNDDLQAQLADQQPSGPFPFPFQQPRVPEQSSDNSSPEAATAE